MKIIKYETIGADDLRNLDEQVMSGINDGWQPFGSISCTATERIDGPYYIYVQPMVLYAPLDRESQ